MAKMSSFVLTMCSWIVVDLLVIEHAFHVPILQQAEMRGRFEFIAMNFSFEQGLVTVFGWSGFQSFKAKILFRIGRVGFVEIALSSMSSEVEYFRRCLPFLKTMVMVKAVER